MSEVRLGDIFQKGGWKKIELFDGTFLFFLFFLACVGFAVLMVVLYKALTLQCP